MTVTAGIALTIYLAVMSAWFLSLPPRHAPADDPDPVRPLPEARVRQKVR